MVSADITSGAQAKEANRRGRSFSAAGVTGSPKTRVGFRLVWQVEELPETTIEFRRYAALFACDARQAVLRSSHACARCRFAHG